MPNGKGGQGAVDTQDSCFIVCPHPKSGLVLRNLINTVIWTAQKLVFTKN